MNNVIQMNRSRRTDDDERARKVERIGSASELTPARSFFVVGAFSWVLLTYFSFSFYGGDIALVTSAVAITGGVVWGAVNYWLSSYQTASRAGTGTLPQAPESKGAELPKAA